jgi:hypothetical protein
MPTDSELLKALRKDLMAANMRTVKLRVKLDFLAEAARAVIARWDTPFWKDTLHTGVSIDRLRKALHVTAEPAGSEVKP